MATRSRTPAALVGRPFTTSEALGHIREGTLRGPGYTRLTQGTHVAGNTVDHGLRIRAVRQRLGADVVFLGPSAAWLWGAELARPEQPVHVAVTSGVRRQEYVVPHQYPLDPAHVTRRAGLRVTAPARTCIDLARGVGTTGSGDAWRTAWVDAVLHATHLPAADLCAATAATERLRGLPRGRLVVEAARDGAESVRETLLRLLIVAHGLPEPETQVEVRDHTGAFLARLDMAWRRHRLGLEYDGQSHLQPARWSKDLSRLNRLQAEGWVVVRVDAAALAVPGPFLRQLGRLLPLSGAPAAAVESRENAIRPVWRVGSA